MKKQVYKINSDGYLVEIYIKDFDENEDYPVDFVDSKLGRVLTIDPPNGLYKPKWTGTEWIEGLTQTEIEELNNVVQEPTTVERLQQLETLVVNSISNQIEQEIMKGAI